VKRAWIIIACILFLGTLRAQVPSTCFEIESILVDACAQGNSCNSNADPACQCEGKNEMFRFIVGPDDLDTGDMVCDWPNGGNPWRGVCQNAGTAATVAELNATILNCGWLLEPTNGILPAGKPVLMITSTDMCTASNSFAGLSDTLIIIFQCSGNYTGHFANYNNMGNNLRTLEVNFGQPCDDIVTYNRSFLIDQSGLNTAANGARVDFTWPGAASYHNDGCTAPVSQATFDAGVNETLCPGDVVQLAAEVSSDYSNVYWSGGDGTFSDINDLDATYTAGLGDGEEIILTLNAEGCTGPITDEITVFNLADALTGIDSQGLTAICSGESLTLSAIGSGFFTWSTSVTAPSITVSAAGTYTVSVTNACGTDSESITITEELSPSVNVLNPMQELICAGETVELNASGTGGIITWSTLETGPTIEVDAANWYYATISNDCAVVIDSVQVQITAFPEVEISPNEPLSICQGGTLVLNAAGIGNFTWSTSAVGATLNVTQAGTYSVQATNMCGTATDEVVVSFGGFLPDAQIAADDLSLCPGDMTVLMGSGGDSYEWNGAAAGAELVVDEAGAYVLTALNDCGSDQATVNVIWDQVPVANLTNGNQFAICNGDQALVQVSGTGTFHWSDGAVANSQVFGETGEYYVYAQATCGTDTAFFEVVEEQIIAQAFVTPVSGEAPLEVEFSNETANASIIQWVFELGQVGSGQEAIHTYDESGTYTAQLNVTSALGCEDKLNIAIVVGACSFRLYLPNSFTPDNDGVNDQMKVEGQCVRAFEWHIFDRWGREVFFSQDKDARWSGADASGYAVSDGDYPYWVQILDSNGETHRFSGSITVLR
jgi:gliding motility-associated-like protein